MNKILIVRRDNIGDLVCTLPLIASIRALNPLARIDLLVNSYSAAVVTNESNLDHVYVYTKAKHRSKEETVFGVHARRLWLTLRLLLTRYDWLVLANAGCMPRPLRWAKQIKAKNVIGFSKVGVAEANILTHSIPFVRSKGIHEVEYLMQLLQPFGKLSKIPACQIQPDREALSRAHQLLQSQDSTKSLIGINLSARLPSQQWPAENFIELVHLLTNSYRCVLFWSPGGPNNSGHPGDDEKADQILKACVGMDVRPYPTNTLADLIGGIASIDLLITADGGAMHIGAACKKPIVAMFGDSDSSQWYPWAVPSVILHPASREVKCIPAKEVLDACKELEMKCQI